MIVLKTTDRVPVKFKELKGVTFWVSPLKMEHKQLISQAAVKSQGGEKIENALIAMGLALKFGLKQVDGLKNLDGSEYCLEFEGDVLADCSVDDVLNLPCGFGVSTVVSHIAYGQLDEASKVPGASVDVKSAVVKKK